MRRKPRYNWIVPGFVSSRLLVSLLGLCVATTGFCGQTSYEKVADLLKKLESKHADAAAQKLRALGASAMPHIVRYLDLTPGDETDFNSRVALELSEYGSEAKPELMKCVTSGGLRSRIAVLFALSYMASMLAHAESLPSEVPPEMAGSAMAKHELMDAEKLVDKYRWMRDADAMKAWASAVDDKDVAVRYSAVSLAGFLRIRDAHGSLIKALKDENDQIWPLAFEALVRFGDINDATTLFDALESRHREDEDAKIDDILRALSQRDTALGPAILRKMLSSEDSGLRDFALRELAFRGSSEDIPAFEAMFDDPFEEVRACAVWAAAHLAGRSGTKYIPQLIEISRNADRDIRRDGLRGLAEVGGDEAFNRISEMTKDPNAEVRKDAAYALGHHGDPRGKAVLEAMLKDKDEQVREFAKTGLSILALSPAERAEAESQAEDMMSAEPSFVVRTPPRSPALAKKP